MYGTQNLLLPFDSYCPSIQTKLHSRTCSICKQYIPSAFRLRNHYRVHQQRYASNFSEYNNKKEEEEFHDEFDPIDPNEMSLFQINPSHNAVFLFTDMTDWLRSDFEDDPVIESKPKSSATIANAAIRKEKQLQEAAAAAIGTTLLTMNQTTNIESVATIAVDDALVSTNELIDIMDIKTENDEVSEAMGQLAVTDDAANLSNVQSDSLLNQYDDLSDLIDQI